MVEFKKILFPCDLTENSTRLMPYVLTVSEKFNSIIYLLHVVEDLLKGLEHTLFGSVAENVVKKSPVPVMVINPYTLD